LTGDHGVKDFNIVSKGDGDAEDIGQDDVGGEEGKEREEKGEAGKEVDTQKGPEGEEEGEGIQRLEKGAKKEELSIGFALQGGGGRGQGGLERGDGRNVRAELLVHGGLLDDALEGSGGVTLRLKGGGIVPLGKPMGEGGPCGIRLKTKGGRKLFGFDHVSHPDDREKVGTGRLALCLARSSRRPRLTATALL
jgi:hypothetical protein